MKVYLIVDQDGVYYGIFSSKQNAIANAEEVSRYDICLYIEEFEIDEPGEGFAIWNSWDYMA